MKASTIAIILCGAISSASAWKLDLWCTDGRRVNMHGRKGACKNIEFINVNHAKFAGDPRETVTTFELYLDTDCDGLSYRNDGGDYYITPRMVKSYRVI